MTDAFPPMDASESANAPRTDAPIPTTMPQVAQPPAPAPPAAAGFWNAEGQNRAILFSAFFLLFLATVCLIINDGAINASPAVMVAVLSLGLLGGIATLMVICRRHVALRRAAGYESAIFDCLDLREPHDPHNLPMGVTNGPSRVFDLREVPDIKAIRAEVKVQALLQSIPARTWQGGERPLECSLCMEEVAVGQPIRQLRCTHAFHKKCVRRPRHVSTPSQQR